MTLGLMVTEPAQEDWGWYSEATHSDASYFIGIGGNSQDGAPDRNLGEWRILIEKHRSLWAKVTGKHTLTPDEAILSILMVAGACER
jgi:hypothetical protein